MTDLGVVGIFELSTNERVEGVPVRVDNVAADRPQVTKHKGRTDDRVQFARFTREIHALRHQKKALEQLAQGHHLADVHLGTVTSSAPLLVADMAS